MLLDMFGDTTGREAFVIRFWALALVLHVNFVSNRMPLPYLDGNSPLGFATGEQQTFRWLRTFGTGLTAFVPPEVRGNKTSNFMQPVGRPGVWCGISEFQKGIVAYMLDTGRVEPVAEYKCNDSRPLHTATSTPLPPPPEPAGATNWEPFSPPTPVPVELFDLEDLPIGHDDGPGAQMRVLRSLGNSNTSSTDAYSEPATPTDAPTPPPPSDPPVPRNTRPPSPPWQLASEEPPAAPRRAGSRNTAAQRHNASSVVPTSSSAGSLLLHAADVEVRRNGAPPYMEVELSNSGPFATDDGCVSVELDTGEIACADSCVVVSHGWASTTRHATATGVVARADGTIIDIVDLVCAHAATTSRRPRPPPKIRFVQTPGGMVRKLVPRDHHEAERHPDSTRFWEAMLKEWESQEECCTFEPVPADDPALRDVLIVPLGWVYDIKVNTLTNELVKYKARLVARGNHTVAEVHFYETFSGVVRMSTVRLLLAMAAANSWELTSADGRVIRLRVTLGRPGRLRVLPSR